MCRIFGAFGKKHSAMPHMAISSMNQYHGGPDEQSLLIKDYWALGANRLAIQEIDRGGQPYSLDSKIYAVFNGEIYNYRELKKKLNSKGYKFLDTGDGGVIPSLYVEYGDKFVEHLDGMFAIAIIDLRTTPELLLACDHIGIKSLFYKEESGQVIFSSEIQGLLPLLTQAPEMLLEKIDLYFSMQAIVGETTIFKDIKSLKPGTVKRWKLNGNINEFNFSTINYRINKRKAYAESAKILEELLADEVSLMLETVDVPTCFIISGGIDSSLVSVLAAMKRPELHAFHIAYKGSWPNDERHYALEVAERYNIKLEIIEADPKKFPEIIPRMVKHLGQPNCAPHALSTYLLFKTINDRGFKVAITGEGADEQFGGYARFSEAILDQSDNWWQDYLDKLSAIPRWLREKLYHLDYKHFLRTNPSGYEQVVRKMKSMQRTQHLNQLLKFDLYERFPYYILRRVDHLSMAHSVEVRVPFCQNRVTEFAAKLPESWKIRDKKTKRILYKASETLLPDSILNRPKQPFTLPIQSMLTPPHDLYTFFADILINGTMIKTGILRKRAVELLLYKQAKNPNNTIAKTLWTLGIFELWNNIYRKQYYYAT